MPLYAESRSRVTLFLSRYPIPINVKGATVPWVPETIYITSNEDPATWYTTPGQEQPPQVKRRIWNRHSTVTHFTDVHDSEDEREVEEEEGILPPAQDELDALFADLPGEDDGAGVGFEPQASVVEVQDLDHNDAVDFEEQLQAYNEEQELLDYEDHLQAQDYYGADFGESCDEA